MKNAAGILAAVVAAAVVAVAHASPAPASSPAATALAQAEQQTSQASSVRIGLAMTIRQGRDSFALKATGTELPAGQKASLDLDLSQMSPSLGAEKVLMIGSRAYVHLAALSTPAARKKGIKPWIVEDSASALGIDPWSLAGSATVDEPDDLRLAGSGIDDGVPVTRYAGTISLRKAMAANPQFQKLVANLHAPASLLDITAAVRFDVDRDGYLREVTETYTLRLPGRTPLACEVDFTLGGFDEPADPIVAPPSYDVMTMTDFRRATGALTPIA